MINRAPMACAYSEKRWRVFLMTVEKSSRPAFPTPGQAVRAMSVRARVFFLKILKEDLTRAWRGLNAK